MKKIVFFVRHGESVKNKERIFTSAVQGWPLTGHGREQAETAGKELAAVPRFDRMFASPVLRTRETAEIISRYVNTNPMVVTMLLRERYAGKYENYHYKVQGELMDILHNEIKQGYPEWESWDKMLEKIRKFEAMLNGGEINIAVSHGGNVKAAIGYVLEKTDENDVPDVEALGISSGSITVIDFGKRGPGAILAPANRALPKDLQI